MKAIEITHTETESEKEIVLTWLREFNHAENGDFMKSLSDGSAKDLFLVARSENDEIIGGVGFTIHLKWLKISIMGISPQHRRQGIGNKLMLQAEHLATEKGCVFAYVDTMSYQAPDFYSKLGYSETGRLVDWDSHGHDKIFFTKSL